MRAIKSVIDRLEGVLFGTDATNVDLYYPVMIDDSNNFTFAIFTAAEVEVAIKRAKSNLKDLF